MKPTQNNKIKYNAASKLFAKGFTKEQIKKELNISSNLLNKWFKGFKKLKSHNLEQKFILEFGTGKYSIKELAKKYGVEWRVLLTFKHKNFGKGSIKQLRMYQMFLANIPTYAIADYMNCPKTQVTRAIRKHKNNPNLSK